MPCCRCCRWPASSPSGSISTNSPRPSADGGLDPDPSTPEGRIPMTNLEQTVPLKSGAAGAATFAGSDSRKYNYFEPQGRKATHYEDVTVDVQPDPKRYLLQDWIISFPDGTPTYSKSWTKALSSD